MSKPKTSLTRREQILAALAKLLESQPGERITTAILAKSVGVSEAALYRHFPSKTKMFEGLIDFIEQSIFSEITLVLAEEKSAMKRCESIVKVVLQFVEQHPGLSRLLVGDVLIGETERLRLRIAQFFERIEVQFNQVLRENTSRNTLHAVMPNAAVAHWLMVYIDGALVQYVRSEFQRLPSQHWMEHGKHFSSLLLQREEVEMSA